ncbi:MAG: hypothetical protein D3910_04245 [Candidatus Electrothrix sp. ATG2]|nr:hypothetical protein [Candidatus Electrothrix sp. ATG2]
MRAYFDWTPLGFHAQVIGANGTWYVDPYSQGESYVSYYKKDYHSRKKQFACSVEQHIDTSAFFGRVEYASSSGETLRTFRLAVATTGEYAQFHGGSMQSVLAAVVTTINRVTGIYEKELRVRLSLVGNNDSIIFLNPDTDPFSGNNHSSTLIDESQNVLDSYIGEANYDIGHTFSTGTGGRGVVGSICQSDRKGKGTSGIAAPVGDPYAVDYVAHEIGHQLGAYHTFNGKEGSCQTNIASSAYEPGSGSTIMSYAGICGDDNLQEHADPIFHSVSYDQIMSYISEGFGSTCGSTGRVDNTAPVVNAGNDYIIPAGTPFVLTGSATDDDGDPLTYRWEERDLGLWQASLSEGDDGFSPLFRTYPSVFTGQRYFPSEQTLIDKNAVIKGEQLPTYKGRTMNFRLTAQDSWGGRSADDMKVLVDSVSDPFAVTFPNGDNRFAPGSKLTVTWDVAGTVNSPISATTVDIYLAVDYSKEDEDAWERGLHWGTPLRENTSNDGSESLTLPEIETERARIIIKASNNIFFDISDHDFSIQPPAFLPSIYSLLLDGD